MKLTRKKIEAEVLEENGKVRLIRVPTNEEQDALLELLDAPAIVVSSQCAKYYKRGAKVLKLANAPSINACIDACVEPYAEMIKDYRQFSEKLKSRGIEAFDYPSAVFDLNVERERLLGLGFVHFYSNYTVGAFGKEMILLKVPERYVAKIMENRLMWEMIWEANTGFWGYSKTPGPPGTKESMRALIERIKTKSDSKMLGNFDTRIRFLTNQQWERYWHCSQMQLCKLYSVEDLLQKALATMKNYKPFMDKAYSDSLSFHDYLMSLKTPDKAGGK